MHIQVKMQRLRKQKLEVDTGGQDVSMKISNVMKQGMMEWQTGGQMEFG